MKWLMQLYGRLGTMSYQLVAGALVLIVSSIFMFQNCDGSQFGTFMNASVPNQNALGNCTDPNCQDISSGHGSCSFNGMLVGHEASVTAYLNSLEPAGGACASETRTCTNGNLSGSYQYASCSVSTGGGGGGASCLFNGATVADGATVTAFLTSSTPVGESCQSEVRACNNGNLSGSYQYASCTSGGPNACLFNGITVPSGSVITAFLNSSAPVGGSCMSEFRVCVNGTLGGTYNYASCINAPQASCLFDGLTIPSGSSVVAFQNSSVPAGQSCSMQTRVCNNGVLSGNYNYSSCSVAGTSSCLFNGQTVPSGSTVTAFSSSSVPYGSTCSSETRACNNGVLSGSYSYPSCMVDGPVACSFNGMTIASGQSVTAFQNSSVPYGQTCVQETRSCFNGALSGSYNYASCAVDVPASCSFNGMTIASGQSVTAFQNSSVPYGQTCVQQTRSCSNGVLSGSYNYASCNVNAPASCSFNGTTVASGASVTAYKLSSVPYGQSCTASTNIETRSCDNGVLSGTYSYASCNVNAPAACLFNGQTIAHGQSVTAYKTSTVAYGASCSISGQSEVRTCSNGALSGSFAYGSCTVNGPASCLFGGQTIAHGQSVVAYLAAQVAYGTSCAVSTNTQTRTCNNGVLSGTYSYASCAPRTTGNWINTLSSSETHAQACARVGMKVPTSTSGINNGGICASAESMPNSGSGDGWDKINYRFGRGKYKPNRGGVVIRTHFVEDGHWGKYKPNRGGVVIRSGGAYCYKAGQKVDNDKTDLLVAYLCL